MAGKRIKPIHPFIERLMAERGYDNLQSFAKDLGINDRTMYRLADGDASHYVLRVHKEIAAAFGITMDEWVDGYLESA